MTATEDKSRLGCLDIGKEIIEEKVSHAGLCGFRKQIIQVKGGPLETSSGG